MTQPRQTGSSASLAISVYGLLLQLYPRPFLRQHRAEMLQNFRDFEQASPSKAALWLFLAKDLAVSIRAQFARTLCGQTAIVVLVLTLLLVCTEGHAVARRHVTEAFCCGYLFGWFAGWFAAWRAGSSAGWFAASSGSCWPAIPSVTRFERTFRSSPAHMLIPLSALLLVIVAASMGPGAQHQVIWALSYGFLLAWFAGWTGNRWQMRP